MKYDCALNLIPGKIHEKVEFIEDEEVAQIDLNTAKDMAQLVALFHGEQAEWNETKDIEVKKLVDKAIAHIHNNNLGYEQFNEILLLLGEDRVERPFFEFFFLMHGDKKNKTKIGKSEIKNGVTRFRGYSMLLFGNFKYAFKKLSKIKIFEEFLRALDPYCIWIAEGVESAKRCEPALNLNHIPRDKTWFTGHLQKDKLDHDFAMLAALGGQINGGQYVKDLALDKEQEYEMDKILKSGELDPELWKKNIDDVDKKLKSLRDDFEKIRGEAETNTKIYLTWDYMHIYFATSMRERWEFFSTWDFLEEVRPSLKKMDLRYFNPTQSFTEDRIEKGLIEGLMLKRAQCTVYLVQESDTLGKDAELAATLAQGKPVIAFVPQISLSEAINRIKSYPVEYLWKRFYILTAEGMIYNRDYPEDAVAEGLTQEDLDSFGEFQTKLGDFICYDRTFNLIKEEEIRFKANFQKEYEITCKLIAIAERRYWEKRAKTLMRHPLGLQVNLDTGVANGLLVVRSPSDCVKLLNHFFEGGLQFKIVNNPTNRQLVENVSNSTFRVVTKDLCLTNAFWNFYTFD